MATRRGVLVGALAAGTVTLVGGLAFAGQLCGELLRGNIGSGGMGGMGGMGDATVPNVVSALRAPRFQRPLPRPSLLQPTRTDGTTD